MIRRRAITRFRIGDPALLRLLRLYGVDGVDAMVLVPDDEQSIEILVEPAGNVVSVEWA